MAKRKVPFKKISPGRVRQIIAFCDDLGLVPANLVTPAMVEQVYNSWRDVHATHVFSQEQLELSHYYLELTLRRLNRRLRRPWKGGPEGNRVSGFPPGIEDNLSSVLYLNFDNDCVASPLDRGDKK